MKKFLLYSLIALFASCGGGQVEKQEIGIPQSNIYEVNIRQYTQEGTFDAFRDQHLERLKEVLN